MFLRWKLDVCALSEKKLKYITLRICLVRWLVGCLALGVRGQGKSGAVTE